MNQRTHEKLATLREIIAGEGCDGFIVPRSDQFLGEYIPAGAERLLWLTCFSGSAGLSIVLKDKACVMSDSRYTIQMAQQIESDLFETVNIQDVSPEDWLLENMPENGCLAYDPALHSGAFIVRLEEKGIRLKALGRNPVDRIWPDRPDMPAAPVSLWPENLAGLSRGQKILGIQGVLKEAGADMTVLTQSDSIAWLLNVRGADIPYIPVVLSYLILPAEGRPIWFIDKEKLTDEISKILDGEVDIRPFDRLENALSDISGKHVLYDPKRSAVRFRRLLEVQNQIVEGDDPCVLPKSIKTTSEQQAMKAAHVRDGVAIVRFLKWFEEELAAGGQLDELGVIKKLEDFRREDTAYLGASFDTIAGAGPNGAIVHYRADLKSNRQLEKNTLLLLDSGAQYQNGTTDITRTLPVGGKIQDYPEDLKDSYTRVLKGHIAVAKAIFEKGTPGKVIDALARAPLMEAGKNYGHGTGHGVGCYLSVHEEAASLSPRGDAALMPGMILSNEPGYYAEGAYGIRIENLILCQTHESDGLCFETITLAPIDMMLVLPDLLNEAEKEWLNIYHAKVYETLAPLLDEATCDWLRQKTIAIS